MSMTEWAENEIKIACEREKRLTNNNPDDYGYGVACYESALKAYKSLAEDGHSGYSWHQTKFILERLMSSKPLTPIEDIDDIWNECCQEKEYQTYQCRRMSSLFKDVYDDGTVKYHDNNRYYCYNIYNPANCWTGGIGSKILDEMFPIAMPYMPSNKDYKIGVEEFLVDPANGDFDTVGVKEIIDPEGKFHYVGRYFKEGPDGLVEIDLVEYNTRKNLKVD